MSRQTKTKQPTKPKFPANVYIFRDDEYLITSEQISEVADGEPVAIYALVEVKTKRTTHTIE